MSVRLPRETSCDDPVWDSSRAARKHEKHTINGANDGFMCGTCHLRIGKGDVNNSNPPEILDAPMVKA
jgi:ferredoxin